jgi:hypothetical protein
MRFLAVVLVAFAVAVPAASASDVSGARLTITVWPDGPGKASHRATLRCAPSGGTLAEATQACARLARMEDPFVIRVNNKLCTMIYGGPQVARVTGTFNGHRVWMTFHRRNGCEIAAWRNLQFLFAT